MARTPEQERRYYEANRARILDRHKARYLADGRHVGQGERDRAGRLGGSRAELARLGKLLDRCRYPGWQFSIRAEGDGFAVIAFRADPRGLVPLQALGPWPLPEDAATEEVRAVALAAVVAVDGEGARERFRMRN
jgi:hypothetical protein